MYVCRLYVCRLYVCMYVCMYVCRPVARIFFGGVRSLERKGYFFFGGGGGGKHPRVCKLIKLRKTCSVRLQVATFFKLG